MKTIFGVIGTLLLFFGLIGSLAAASGDASINPVAAIGAVGMTVAGGVIYIVVAIEENAQESRETFATGMLAIVKQLRSGRRDRDL